MLNVWKRERLMVVGRREQVEEYIKAVEFDLYFEIEVCFEQEGTEKGELCSSPLRDDCLQIIWNSTWDFFF